MMQDEHSQHAEKPAVTKYGPRTRYESGEAESDDAGSTKNFPTTFVPMRELEDSQAEM